MQCNNDMQQSYWNFACGVTNYVNISNAFFPTCVLQFLNADELYDFWLVQTHYRNYQRPICFISHVTIHSALVHWLNCCVKCAGFRSLTRTDWRSNVRALFCDVMGLCYYEKDQSCVTEDCASMQPPKFNSCSCCTFQRGSFDCFKFCFICKLMSFAVITVFVLHGASEVTDNYVQAYGSIKAARVIPVNWLVNMQRLWATKCALFAPFAASSVAWLDVPSIVVFIYS